MTMPGKTTTLNKEDFEDFRMYREKYPKIDELVMAEVTRIESTGVYLKLIEYQDLEGLMMLSELSKRRWRTVSKLVQVNRREIVSVMRVDYEKGYVDLSKKRVPANERNKFMVKFKNSHKVHSIFRQSCAICSYPIEEAYESFGWKLYDDFPHAINGLELLNNSAEEFFSKYTIPEKLKDNFVEVVCRRLTKKSKKVRTDFELNCFTSQGILSIMEALKQGEILSTKKIPIKIQLIASPTYTATTVLKDPQDGIKRLEEVCTAIETRIKELKGTMTVVRLPCVEEENTFDVDVDESD